MAEKSFEVEASQDRVWRLIGKVIFSSLPGMENMEILDENNFRAVLRMKTLGIPVSVRLKGEMMDVTPPDSFSVRLFIEGLGGLFKADQKVAFAMTSLRKKEDGGELQGDGSGYGIFAAPFSPRPGPELRKFHL